MGRTETEAATRRTIDHQLSRAGWGERDRRLIEELRISDGEWLGETREEYRAGDEFVDYVLLGRDGRPLAIVEAKRSSRDAIAGKRQAEDYARRIAAHHGREPFIFLANGREIWFWDRERYPARQVRGFFTREDLERLEFLRQYRRPLASVRPNTKIAGRTYQMEAIRRVTEAMERGQRKFLLVMATGTGKTRVAIALVDVLLQARWTQRMLFLADRRELVKQAIGAFKEHLPQEGWTRIEGGVVDNTARIHLSTYPSMMQCYEALSPGYYDLVIADESHRSIYNRYKVLLDHFDAMQLGLTATPTDYIDHNTFELFECPDGLPTFYYPYERAVEDGHLVNYRVLEAQTTFQIEGIKAGQLPEGIRRQIEAQGIELSEINFEGSDLERRITNTGTNDAIVREFLEKARKDETGVKPAKTIIFAMSHAHARELWESFNRVRPDWQREGFAEIIDSHMERADRLLDDFRRKDMPRVAISVDMLDTGVDVPAIQNLVFAKPVFSQVKFWQMLGRGTRLWRDPKTGQPKKDFLIIDHWNNFAFFNMNPEGEVAALTEALPVRLFRLRLDTLERLRLHGNMAAAEEMVRQLQRMLAELPEEAPEVQAHREELALLRQVKAWEELTLDRLGLLRQGIAPLLRFLPSVNLDVMTFEARIEQLAMAYLDENTDQVQRLREKIVEALLQLPTALPEVQAESENLARMISEGFWSFLSYDRIRELQQTFAPLMRYRQPRRRDLIRLSLPDQIASRRWVLYGPSGEGAFADSYREEVETEVRRLAEEHPSLLKLKHGEPLDEEDVASLAQTLNQADLFITETVLQEVYEQPEATLVDFVRHILHLSRLASREEQIKAAFDAFLTTHPRFTATQIAFLRLVRAEVLQQAQLTDADLERPPFSRVGAARRLFDEGEISEILALANRFAA